MPTLKRKSSQKRKQSCKQQSKRVDKNIPKKNKRNKRLRSKRKMNGGLQETYKQPGVIEKMNDKIYINFLEANIPEGQKIPVKQIVFTGRKEKIEPLYNFLYDFKTEEPPITWDHLNIGFKKNIPGIIILSILGEDILIDSTNPLYFQDDTETEPIFFYEEMPSEQQDVRIEFTKNNFCEKDCPFTINLEKIKYGTIHYKTLYFLIGLALILKMTIAELDPSVLSDTNKLLIEIQRTIQDDKDYYIQAIPTFIKKFGIIINTQNPN